VRGRLAKQALHPKEFSIVSKVWLGHDASIILIEFGILPIFTVICFG
jgi:hypothetical protein